MTNKRNLVVKDNTLINASYRLGLVEQRLLLLVVVAIRQQGQKITADTKISLHADSYKEHFGVSRQVAYQALKDGCDGIFGREYSYKDITEQGERVVRSHWVSQIAYIEQTATVELYFTPDVLAKITELEKHFTQYELERVAKLNSKYAVRLYEIVISWRNKGKTDLISLDDLRERLGLLPDEYKLTADFKKRVLEKSIDEINEKTDIKISYEQHKQGRNIKGFTFSIKTPKNKTDKADNQRDGNTIDAFSSLGMTDKQRQMFASKLSQLPQLGHLAPAGADYADFARWIEQDLLDPERASFYRPYLAMVGYKFKD